MRTVGRGAPVRAGFDPARSSFFIDRQTASPRFAGLSERHDAARPSDAAELTLEVWVDGSTVELSGDGGTVVISDLVYPDPLATGVAPFHGAENPLLTLLELQQVRSTMQFA